MSPRKYWRVLVLVGVLLAGGPALGRQPHAAAAAPGCALVGRETEAPLGENLLAAVAAAPGDVWAAGSISAAAGAWHWTGTSWLPMALPVPSGTIRGLAALSPTDVWAVGDVAVPALAPQVGDRPLALHWTGQAWQEV
ncbi:MAG TPA: hypothetical protein VKY74_13040, partial [Chloroflexia bacterium]|nr:hypothetical protein [Chloroflexia bacterium]